jgi:flagellar motility protein MotE (MotC chaperone)
MVQIKMTQTRKTKRRSGRGAIMVIAMLLLSSALLRIASGSGAAVAQALTPEDAAPQTEGATPQTMAEATAEQDKPTATPSRTEIGELLTALRAREERVKAVEARIDMRSKALAVADAEITKRLATLEQAEANLRRTLALANGAAEGDLARLTSVYESMKPKDAAALFQAMEPDFAAGFLGRMRPDAAGAVMANLPPEVAYSISVILAGRNAKAPKS